MQRSSARRHDHITPVLTTFQQLPVRQRVIFKTAMLVWKCLHDAAPRYLADLCVPVSLCIVAVLCCVWPQDLEPITNGPPITGTNALIVQAPAQDPPVPALDSAGCSCGCRVPSSGAVVTVYSEFGANYKCPDSTRTRVRYHR